jgi:tetratricopeptide (TPR) repeat protein
VAAALPIPMGSLSNSAFPVPTTGFGEIDLPTAAESLPVALPSDHHLPTRSHTPFPGPASFGEIELPREYPRAAGDAPGVSRDPSGDFGNLELDDKPRSRRSSPRNAAVVRGAAGGGGMTFGEVDLSSPQEGSERNSSIGVAAFPGPNDPEQGAELRGSGREATGVFLGAQPAATALVRSEARSSGRQVAATPVGKRSMVTRAAIALLVAAVLAGAALQLTPHGAYGYLDVSDRIRASDYERAAAATIGATEKVLGADTYDEAKEAVDAAAAAHARMPRARPLTAYAAAVDYAATVRFGPDTSRSSRAKQLLAELPDEPTKYRDVAIAAQAAANDDLDRARKVLEAAASNSDPGDPIQIEVAHLRGDVELAARDGDAAVVAFKQALALSNDARAHFGLARAYEVLGDSSNARKEIAATLAASPQHPGALTLRAGMNSTSANDAQALGDLATVLDGQARGKAAPNELSKAYAVRAWVALGRGAATEARDAFAQAATLDPRNVLALGGEGRLLLGEGRYTEALARFDAALQLAPGSPDAIADDAEAKLALDRLADAKQQLVDARQRFPKSLAIVLLLGRVEQHLGNSDTAESYMRAAIAMVDPTRRDAIRPYVALSELLSSRGRLADAKAVLEEAKKSLGPSGALDRAMGDVAELQGDHDLAMAQYRAALSKDPRDAAAHFSLAATLRHVRKFADAGAELDKIVSVDKDYPGLSLERGLLFEDSGDIQKAIEQFKTALARAPEDPDLQLRVGSAYVSIGRPDDAIPMLRKVLQVRPLSAEGQHYLGRALMLKGSSQQAEALRYLQRAVDADPNRAEFHVYLAWAANEATPAQFDLASKEIDAALSLDKLNAEGYWQRGILERMQGAVVDAIKDEKRALELRPSRYEAHAILAECYEDRSDFAGAMAEWAKAIAGDGDAAGADGGVPHPYWRYKYGKLLMERGNLSAAIALLLPAATTMEKSEQRPGWLPLLEVLTAEALDKAGRRAEAVEHYRRFMDIAPVNSPDRDDARAALGRLTGER